MSSIHDFVDLPLNEPGWVKKRIQRIADDLEQERPHASLREGPKNTPEKRFIIEQSIVQELLHSMDSKGDAKYFGPILPPSSGDPPDCVVFDRSGRPVAVEVTEFVSRKAIEENLKIKRDPEKTQRDRVYWDWRPNEVVTKINDIIRNKDGKTLNGGPYTKKILVIHTDEEIFSSRRFEYAEFLQKQSFGPVGQIDEVYFLFPYVGRAYPCDEQDNPLYDSKFDEGHPYIKLSLKMA